MTNKMLKMTVSDFFIIIMLTHVITYMLRRDDVIKAMRNVYQ